MCIFDIVWCSGVSQKVICLYEVWGLFVLVLCINCYWDYSEQDFILVLLICQVQVLGFWLVEVVVVCWFDGSFDGDCLQVLLVQWQQVVCGDIVWLQQLDVVLIVLCGDIVVLVVQGDVGVLDVCILVGVCVMV